MIFGHSAGECHQCRRADVALRPRGFAPYFLYLFQESDSCPKRQLDLSTKQNETKQNTLFSLVIESGHGLSGKPCVYAEKRY